MVKKDYKINQLVQNWPRGTVGLYAWFKQFGIYQQLIGAYVKSSWLKRIGKGAYVLTGDNFSWQGGLYALQKHLNLSVHAGGKTALQMHGLAHFVPVGSSNPMVYLNGLPEEKLPGWFVQYDWQAEIHYINPKLFLELNGQGLTEIDVGAFSVKIASPELAMMELLQLVPQQETFSEAKLLAEGLTTLRPQLVQFLLEKCHSIKVKRLFLHLAEQYEHTWVKRLDLSKVDLGKGKRVIGEGGHYDSKYQLSVPSEE